MTKTSNENMRRSTAVRYRSVHDIYNKVIKDLGEYAFLVPKSYIYGRIKEETGLSARTILRALNHMR